MMSIIGLGLIVLGWAYQAYYTSKKDKHIRTNFLILYGVGSSLLVIDGLLTGVSTGTLLQASTALLSVLVILRTQSGSKNK